ncbi:hypothetical protein [uncultured Vagococcus sp.]|uniref:hypothetical protein n=1 Tax=uncultured Vagococcus sp. TaxID=189676 RepID=UPI0028D7C29E|nr:hypothetical protein [uncultured Vagococcus sp.]
MRADITVINKKINDAKKEIDRLEDLRIKDLSNSINYIENEIQIQRCEAQVEAYETAVELINSLPTP